MKDLLEAIKRTFREFIVSLFVRRLNNIYERFLKDLKKAEKFGSKYKIITSELSLVKKEKVESLNGKINIVRSIFSNDNSGTDNVGDNSHVEQQDGD